MQIFDLPRYNGPGVYMLRNAKNGMVYIGSSQNVHDRMLLHNSCFYNRTCNSKFMRDLGKGHWLEVSILERLPDGVTPDELRRREDEYVRQYNAVTNGYNMKRVKVDRREAEKRQADWARLNTDRLSMSIRKDAWISRSVIQAAATALGVSVTHLVSDALRAYIPSALGDDWLEKNGNNSGAGGD